MHNRDAITQPVPYTSWLGLMHQRRGKRRRFGGPARQGDPAGRADRYAYFLALGIISIITLACLNMAFVMASGLPTNPSMDSRIAFLAEYTTVWQLGWFNWMLCALGLLAFSTLVAQYVPGRMLRTYALILIGIGIAPDISAEMLYAFVLPEIKDTSTFLLLDRIAMLLTGFVANGVYCIGGLILNVGLLRNPNLNRYMLYFGIPSWLLGIMVSVVTALNQMPAASIFTGLSMVWNVLWMFWFTQSVLRFPEQVTSYD
jgi:hypothetical protein